MGQLAASKLGKEYDKVLYCHLGYITHVESMGVSFTLVVFNSVQAYGL